MTINNKAVSEKRLKELERAEAKLNALEVGGVDNWEWYGESLKSYHAENEPEESRADLISELAYIFGECAYEPSERGAGISFTDDAHSSAMDLLAKRNVQFKTSNED